MAGPIPAATDRARRRPPGMAPPASRSSDRGAGLDEHVDVVDDQPAAGEHRLPARLLDRRRSGRAPGRARRRRRSRGRARPPTRRSPPPSARGDPRRARTRSPTAIDAASRSIHGVVCIIGSVAIAHCTADGRRRSSPSNAATMRSGTRRGRLRNGRSWSTMSDHPGAAQRGVRREPPPRGDVGQRETCETQREPDRGPPLRDVVVEIAEQLLVARVEVRGGGDQEQIEIDLVEVEAFRQAPRAASRRAGPANLPPTGPAGRRVRSASLVGRTPPGHAGHRSSPDRRVDRQRPRRAPDPRAPPAG